MIIQKKNINIINYSILGIFSFFFNFWASNRGVFPIDTFLHYDSAYKILNNEIPIRDFWIIHGLALDYIQSIFFRLFGTNWISYIVHSSIINAIITLIIFNFFKKLELNNFFSFTLSLAFAILAYPVSGVPFVDHHSTILSLSCIIFFYFAILKNNYIYFLFIPMLFGIAFLSKPVPAIYIALIFAIVFTIYFIKEKKFIPFVFLIIGSISFLTLLYFFLKIQKIPINLFLEQIIYYPMSAGGNRFENIQHAFSVRIFNFKFILFFIFYTGLILFLKKNTIKIQKHNYYIIILIFLFTFSMMFHQLMTKNQNFIFFLIPLTTALAVFVNIQANLDYKKLINLIFISLTLILLIKYNERFNIDRKFHDLENVNLKNYISASKIDKSLHPLKWITSDFENPEDELILIRGLINELESADNKNILLISNYNFVDSITKKKIYSVIKNYDDVTIPPKNSLHYEKFKNYFIYQINTKKIEKIFIFLPKRNLDLEFKNIIQSFLIGKCYVHENIMNSIKVISFKPC
jgi:hypothetical protein